VEVDVVKPESQSVETLQSELEKLVLERQHLRRSGAPPSELEENRRAIARGQHEFSLALIARYAHASAA
jgi:hypothetical protein